MRSGSRPNMRFVLIKSIEQQDILSIHRVRQRLVKNRTALANEIRGLLHEFGFIIPQGINKVIPMLMLCARYFSPPLRQKRSPLHTNFFAALCHPPF